MLFAVPVLAASIFGSLATTSVFAQDANSDLAADNVSSMKTDGL